MTTIPVSPVPTPRPKPAPGGSAGSRPAGPAGVRPAGGAGSHPALRRSGSDPLRVMAHRRRLTIAFVELFLEVEAGCRPPRQLAPLLDPMLYARLSRVWFRGGCPGHVVSVSVIGDQPDAFDAIALVRRGARSGAVSLRLARSGGRWRVEDLARPEDGALPGPAYRVVVGDDTDDDAEIPVVALRGTDADGGRPGTPAAPPPRSAWLLPAPTG